MDTKNVKNNEKSAKLMKFDGKNYKNAFFENVIFGIFGGAKKSKNRIIKNVKISSNDHIFLSRHSKEGS